MVQQDKNVTKKRGRPATGHGRNVGLRLKPDIIARVDAWAEAQGDEPTRAEAIRRLIDLGLSK